MNMPFLRKAVRLLRDEGFSRIEIRFDETNRPFVVGIIGSGPNYDDDIAARIDRA